jgi:glyoxylase-like metal-dependent hydrolase (beta-lactamase superfamily II)
MEVVRLLPELHLLRFTVGPASMQAYLWRDGDELTLVDAGPAGSGPVIAAAVVGLGLDRRAVRRVLLTHHHADHVGGAAEVAGWDGAVVAAHRLDAPVVRGEAVRPAPDLAEWERPLHARITPAVPPAPPARVDRELDDGDLLNVGGGARVLHIPGHTAGSVALHLPGPSVLFTGDTVAGHEGRVILGVFNDDRAAAAESSHRLAGLDVEVACFGHGNPVVGGAAAALRAAAADLP